MVYSVQGIIDCGCCTPADFDRLVRRSGRACFSQEIARAPNACRLAAYQLEQKSFMKDKKLVQTLMTKVIMLAGVEKQAAAIDDLCGTNISLAH